MPILFSVLIAGCATRELDLPASQVTASPVGVLPNGVGELIEPGEMVGDFLVAKGRPGEYVHIWDYPCDETTAATVVCEADVSTIFNISYSLTPMPDMDLAQVWAAHTAEIVIDGRPVNLPAFGTVDIVHPGGRELRAWNIVIVPTQPATSSVHITGAVKGDPFELTRILIYRPLD